MQPSHIFGQVVFLLCVVLLAWAAVAPKPQSRFGRRGGILVAGILVTERRSTIALVLAIVAVVATVAVAVIGPVTFWALLSIAGALCLLVAVLVMRRATRPPPAA